MPSADQGRNVIHDRAASAGGEARASIPAQGRRTSPPQNEPGGAAALLIVCRPIGCRAARWTCDEQLCRPEDPRLLRASP
jgi:hypothetical protein